MSLVAYKANNHPQQTRRRGANDEVDDRSTTREMFDPLHARFRFTIDVAASSGNAKRPRYFDKIQNGLYQRWAGERVWCNPPYSDIASWVAKAWAEWNGERPPQRGICSPKCGVYASCGASGHCLYADNRPQLIVMLLPANRTEQRWWQEMVEPFRDQPDSPLRVEFLPGRPRFIRKGKTEVGPNERPPFGCCLVIWQAPEVSS